MSPTQTIAVGARLFAIWLLWYGVTHVAATYFGARRSDYDLSLMPFAVGLALIALIVVLLWIFPTFLAKMILPKQTEPSGGAPVFDDWFSVGCSLLGVWALAKAIPALSSYLIINYLGQKMYPGAFNVDRDRPLHVAFNVFQLLFGAWLFFGAKGLKKILAWARER